MKTYEHYRRYQITKELIRDAALLFSSHYGVWSQSSEISAGARVIMGPTTLRAQCLLPGADCEYVTVRVDGELVGYVFACRWNYGSRIICWVTQLVVHRDHRISGLATGLLNELRRDSDDIYGILSSHPAACLTTAKVFGRVIDRVDTAFIRANALQILQASPIPYIKSASPHGMLFDPNVKDGAVSIANTGFDIDHSEPLHALQEVRKDHEWPLGELRKDHEFILVLEAKSRPESFIAS